MGKRRDAGQGSLYQRDSDHRWVGTVELAPDPMTGKRRRRVVTAKTRREAAKKLAQAKKELLITGTLATSSPTVAEWCDRWLAQRVHEVRPNTYNGERSYVTRWIVPRLGRRHLSTLTPGDLRNLADSMVEDGRSTTTARVVQRVLQQILRAARTEGYSVAENVIEAKKRRAAVSDRTAIPLDDARHLLDVARGHDDGSRWVAALLQGMRQGECLGLTWDCVDLAGKSIDISWQLQTLPYRVPGDPTSGSRVPDGYEARPLRDAYHLVRPKSKKGYRVIPIIPEMESDLLDWREKSGPSPYGLVWPAEDGGPRPSKADGRAWKRLQDEASVWKGETDSGAHRYYVLHEARHTTSTLLLWAGVDPEVIKAILGHSSIVTTQGYQHVNMEMKRRALEAVASELALSNALPELGG